MLDGKSQIQSGDVQCKKVGRRFHDSSLGNIRWEVKIVVAIARDGKNGEKSEKNVKEHRKMVRSVVSSDDAFMCCCPNGCDAQNALATSMFDLICLPIQSSTIGGEHWALD